MDALAGGILGLALGFGITIIGMRVSRVSARLERKLDALLRHAGLDMEAIAAEKAGELLRAGHKMEAIQVYREYAGCSLAEAKARVDAMI
jgi:ribosomal protein L7/L12